MHQPPEQLSILLDRLRRDRRRDPYSGRREYSQAARELADRCHTLIKAGEAAVAVPVLRKAVDRMATALMYMDSSSGELGNDLWYLMDLYAGACRDAPPRPIGLAGWLVKVACDGPGWPKVKLHDWAPALGPKGLAEVARLVDQRTEASESEQRSIRDLRVQLAEVAGDVDQQVEILAEYLPSAAAYVPIVKLLAAARRPADAINWARRGIAADTSSYPWTSELRDLLVGLLIQTNERAAAVEVRWAAFDTQPMVENLRALLATVAATGHDTDPTDWALAVIRDRAAQQTEYLPHLIDALILIGHHDEAWQTGQARNDELAPRRRVELVELRRPTHPSDVLVPYRSLIDAQLLDSLDKRRYEKTITLLHGLQEAHEELGEAAEFATYLKDLREAHRRRPTFLTKLDAAFPAP